MDFYQTLGVSRDATKEDIRKAYRKLAMEHHPDKGGDVSKFQAISEAYETLGDENKRAQYDNPGPSFENWGPGHPFGDAFESIFGVRRNVRRNPDGVSDIVISVGKAYSGTDITVNLGYANEVIQIPPGVRDNTKFRLRGKGPARYKDLPPGDLIIRVNIEYPPDLGRENDDLFIRAEVNAIEAIRGTDINYTHVSGKELKIKVPAGTQPGSRLRVPGYGMPNPHSRVNGDLYVLVTVTIPKVTDQQHIQWLNIINTEGKPNE